MALRFRLTFRLRSGRIGDSRVLARPCTVIRRDLNSLKLDSQSPVRDCCILNPEENRSMTYLDIAYRYGATPGEREMRAIDGMREVYGIRKVDFKESEKRVRVEYDASRLTADAVAKLLRQAGIDVRERLALV
jgi:hypothetical protein